MRPTVLALAVLLTLPSAASAQVGGFMTGLAPSRLCRPAIEMAERRHGIPSRLLHAIGRVESGRVDPATGQVNPWPWTANAEGQGFYFNTKAEAVATVTALRGKGTRSIDIGCMQVNLHHHPDAFASLEQAFDPMANADYAARFLRRLFDQTGSWQKAAAWYHSATPELGEAYQKRVMAAWPEEQKLPAAGTSALAAAWGATLVPPGRTGATRMLPSASGSAAAEPQAPLNQGGVPGGGQGVGQGAGPGRTLDSYRATPITWVYRPIAAPSAAPATARPTPAPAITTPARPSVHFLR